MIKNLQYIVIILGLPLHLSPLLSSQVQFSKRTKNLVQIKELFFGELQGFFHLTTVLVCEEHAIILKLFNLRLNGIFATTIFLRLSHYQQSKKPSGMIKKHITAN